MNKIYHKPVMVNEVVETLVWEPCGRYIDATTGEGGHSEAILKKLTSGELYCMDGDEEILEVAKKRLSGLGKVRFFNKDLSEIKHMGNGFSGVLFDLGISSYHIEASGRGFSFMRDEPLDMRFNKRNPLNAAIILNTWGEKELLKVFKELGEIKKAEKLVYEIENFRKKRPFKTTVEFSGIIKKAFGERRFFDIAPKAFMALRIAVNKELEKLEKGLQGAFEILKKGGRLVVLSYHSLEDRVVKNFFRELKEKGLVDAPKKVIKPKREEIKENPRARSARMRFMIKL